MSKAVAGSGRGSKAASRASMCADEGDVPAGLGMSRSNVSDDPAIGVDQRHRMIAEAAYFRAEMRAFACGCELEDWLAAEREIDTLLAHELGSAGGRRERRGGILSLETDQQ